MYLTREEERILEGEEGEAKALAMKLIVRVGEALGAERLIEITHAHASGISYDNIGEPGLRLIRRLADAGGRVAVYSTYNPAGVSIGAWSPLNKDDLLRKQYEVIEALERMGFERSVTCIPYMLRAPRVGEHLAWGESSAVAVANTLYGARTNREGGPIALAAALTGKTYYWGLHVPENRRATVIVRAELPEPWEPWTGLLGYIIGGTLPGHIPYIETSPRLASWRQVASMCAAAAASGNTAMCLVKGLSPEAPREPPSGLERISIDEKELLDARDRSWGGDPAEAELFFTGCPHHEPLWLLERLTRLLQRYGAPRRPVYVAVPARLPPQLREALPLLRRRNIHLLPGTCLVVSRLRGLATTVATDSVKTAFYLPRRHGVRVVLASLEEYMKTHGGGAA